MSLDIAVLDDDDTIARSVSIGVEAHWRLMNLRERTGESVLARLGDYYADAEIFHQELILFADELRALQPQAEGDPELKRTIGDLISLSLFARDRKRSLLAIPD